MSHPVDPNLRLAPFFRAFSLPLKQMPVRGCNNRKAPMTDPQTTHQAQEGATDTTPIPELYKALIHHETA